MCTHQKLWCVHAKIEACVSTVETPIYQLARQPFFVSIRVKVSFWLLLFCFPKKLGIGSCEERAGSRLQIRNRKLPVIEGKDPWGLRCTQFVHGRRTQNALQCVVVVVAREYHVRHVCIMDLRAHTQIRIPRYAVVHSALLQPTCHPIFYMYSSNQKSVICMLACMF